MSNLSSLYSSIVCSYACLANMCYMMLMWRIPVPPKRLWAFLFESNESKATLITKHSLFVSGKRRARDNTMYDEYETITIWWFLLKCTGEYYIYTFCHFLTQKLILWSCGSRKLNPWNQKNCMLDELQKIAFVPLESFHFNIYCFLIINTIKKHLKSNM